ncbi:hypothetical protein A1Q2_04544 [Trichosporon asahii var. asahii CBS 8904]|uniref:Uncharacterized protein n=1 Tax=Trichosporon asahii var. asahii (strain CBS 8904) TaxID=1220162 RepID=K1VKD5_TRIAC|nr:hypothetical protein A1Q2_04544 [Trichosporon asahii var. asahii CBS 8904]
MAPTWMRATADFVEVLALDNAASHQADTTATSEGLEVSVEPFGGDAESSSGSSRPNLTPGVKRKADDDIDLDEFTRTKAHLVSFLTGVISALDETSFDDADAKAPHRPLATPHRSSDPQHDHGDIFAGVNSSPKQQSRPASAININIGSLGGSTKQTASEKVTSSLTALRTRLNAIQDEVDVRKATTNMVKLKSSVLSSRVKNLTGRPTDVEVYASVLSGYEARLQELLFDHSLLSHEINAAKTELHGLHTAMAQCERETSDHRSDKAYLKELLDMRTDQLRAQGRVISERDEQLRAMRKEHEREVWKLKERHAAELNGYKKGQATLQRKLWEKENPGKTLPHGFLQNRFVTK